MQKTRKDMADKSFQSLKEPLRLQRRLLLDIPARIVSVKQ